MARTYYHRHTRKPWHPSPWWRQDRYHKLRQAWRRVAQQLPVDLEQVWPDLKREWWD